jgi:hypothetical protein
MSFVAITAGWGRSDPAQRHGRDYPSQDAKVLGECLQRAVAGIIFIFRKLSYGDGKQSQHALRTSLNSGIELQSPDLSSR